jgi:hypothetical protein
MRAPTYYRHIGGCIAWISLMLQIWVTQLNLADCEFYQPCDDSVLHMARLTVDITFVLILCTDRGHLCIAYGYLLARSFCAYMLLSKTSSDCSVEVLVGVRPVQSAHTPIQWSKICESWPRPHLWHCGNRLDDHFLRPCSKSLYTSSLYISAAPRHRSPRRIQPPAFLCGKGLPLPSSGKEGRVVEVALIPLQESHHVETSSMWRILFRL